MPTALEPRTTTTAGPHVAPLVDVVIPVFNEAKDLAASVSALHTHLSTQFPFTWRITIADNASVDDTWSIAVSLAETLSHVRLVQLPAKGRGRALREAWATSDSDIVAYMDVDLSTDLAALLPLVAPLVSGHSDIAIGSRLAPGCRVVRGAKREFISRSYNRLIHLMFRSRFRDAQCGFKALRSDVARLLVPAVSDESWFFDTELLLLAEHNGLRIAEVPVDWIDDPNSSVSILSTAWEDIKGLMRVGLTLRRGKGRLDVGRAERLPVGFGTVRTGTNP
jgi:glycosyltransferase involved in cell wall biosynthesis